MKILFRLVTGLCLSILTAIATSEIYVRIYVYGSGGALEAHSEDYGMAFGAVLSGGLAFFVTAIAYTIYCVTSSNRINKE